MIFFFLSTILVRATCEINFIELTQVECVELVAVLVLWKIHSVNGRMWYRNYFHKYMWKLVSLVDAAQPKWLHLRMNEKSNPKCSIRSFSCVVENSHKLANSTPNDTRAMAHLQYAGIIRISIWSSRRGRTPNNNGNQKIGTIGTTIFTWNSFFGIFGRKSFFLGWNDILRKLVGRVMASAAMCKWCTLSMLEYSVRIWHFRICAHRISICNGTGYRRAH